MANITKRDVLNALNTINFTEDVALDNEVVVTPEHIRDFIEKSLVQLDAKNVKAAERAAAKKQAGDELRAQIKNVIAEAGRPVKIAEIVETLNNEDITTAKVVARVTQLCKNGEVVKDEIKENGRTLKTYAIV